MAGKKDGATIDRGGTGEVDDGYIPKAMQAKLDADAHRNAASSPKHEDVEKQIKEIMENSDEILKAAGYKEKSFWDEAGEVLNKIGRKDFEIVEDLGKASAKLFGETVSGLHKYANNPSERGITSKAGALPSLKEVFAAKAPDFLAHSTTHENRLVATLTKSLTDMGDTKYPAAVGRNFAKSVEKELGFNFSSSLEPLLKDGSMDRKDMVKAIATAASKFP